MPVIKFYYIPDSPCQNIDNNSAAHHEGHQGAFALSIDGSQQHYHSY